MTITESGWSTAEKKIADQVLGKAYQRETTALINQVQQTITNLQCVDDLWQLNDLLSAKRFNLDGKYDGRESMLIFTFAQLLKEGWVELNELQELEHSKLTKISSLSKM
jgi:hypothetical protein